MAKKTIDTLINDIQDLILNGIEINDSNAQIFDKFAIEAGSTVKKRFTDTTEKPFTLRFSNIGHPCARKLWLEKNHGGKRIPFRSDTLIKFQFGDLTESYILFLTELAGHRVEGTQDEVTIAGIKGHRDAVIDGELVDVKSASSFSFKKFKEGLKPETDNFGYITQLLSYLEASQDDPIVINKDRAHFLAFDKQHGHLCLDTHQRNPEINWVEFFEERKRIINSEDIPERAFQPLPDGYKKNGILVPNGNEYLPPNCAYCDMKNVCWENIRTFLYSHSGPKFFTKIVKEPNVPEIVADE